jgi:SAM-dependent methyltransferase
MTQATNFFYSLPEIWNFCLTKIYDKEAYVNGLEELFQQRGITKQSLILDAGCGSGFPAIDLIQRGYRVMATDKSGAMVRQVRVNAEKKHLSVEVHNIMWAGLSQQFGPVFDFLYCRGNSLIYAASWEQDSIAPERCREEIAAAIQNFYQVLKPSGQAYIDMVNNNEKPYKKVIGVFETNGGPVEIAWQTEHDGKSRVRCWTNIVKCLGSGVEKEYKTYSYFLRHQELVDLLKKAGFKRVEEGVPVAGEPHYKIFIATK